MSELCTPVAERARKANAMLLQALKAPGSQVAIAASLGASESTISRIKNERLHECLMFLYAAGFKVVPQGRVCVDPVKFEAVMTLARAAMGDEETARKLVWEDE